MVAVYLSYCAVDLRRRNEQSWESLAGRLNPAWNMPGAVNIGAMVVSRRKLLAVYREAGVIMAMADFAERNGTASDPSFLAALRADTLQLRLAVLKVIARRPNAL